ncbi:MAG: class I SAM-dependent methyltransferase [Akkermansiaceae bacterium]|nr:class I SAM-dependent methyltransferase [Akkermansiaceae bacterium]
MSFDRIAPFYGPMEHLLAGWCMQRARLWLMEGSHRPERVLMVGEGPGRFLEAFRARFPDAEITVVDGSAGMLEIARRRLGDDTGVAFVHARLEDWETDRRFDLIVTNFLLDCLPRRGMEEAVEKLAGCAAPQAEWWIAEFDLPERGAARWRGRFILRSLYLFFGMVAGVTARKLHPPDDALGRAGFTRAARTTWSWGLLKSERWTR